jgi:hypothetical protein
LPFPFPLDELPFPPSLVANALNLLLVVVAAALVGIPLLFHGTLQAWQTVSSIVLNL